ncbi:MAG: hypothetical protein HYY06_28570 [Deltaproteobacteria bacterium]|nr:hypothetical protein [Deltaproteobacteria bacterium]
MTLPVTSGRPVAASTPRTDRIGLPGVGAEGFSAILRANELCESGGRFVASRRATTAAAPAGFGRAQLNTRNHVELLGRLSDPRLARLGLDREDLATLSDRGSAAQDWYTAIVGGNPRSSSVVTPAEAQELSAITAKDPMVGADLDEMVRRVGRSFHETTGLDPSEVRFMASTRLLGSRRLAAEYHRELGARGDRSSALGALEERQPALRLLRDRVGDEGIVRYWTDHRLNENRAAWYTRAAMTAQGPFDRLAHALEAGGDRWTSERLVSDHAGRALGFASGLEGFFDLPESDRVLLVGQLTRLLNLAPAVFEALVLAGGKPPTDVGELEARLAAAMDDPESDAGRALRAFERSLQRVAAMPEGPTRLRA